MADNFIRYLCNFFILLGTASKDFFFQNLNIFLYLKVLYYDFKIVDVILNV